MEPFIDWNFFFPAWGLKGCYPEILDDAKYGEQARKLHSDALALLERIKRKRSLRLEGVVGIFEAVGRGDDIEITDRHGKRVVMAQLRSQRAEEPESLSVADYVVQADTGATDHVGVFALTAGAGLKDLEKSFRDSGDDYNAILSKLLADRLTEAFAEMMHLFVRREMWGYEGTDTEARPADIIEGRYQGLRYAFGYPATPDHSLKREVFELLSIERTTSMRLTDNWMIDPGEALCGMIVADRDARYFAVGTVDDEQVADYARRRGLTEDDIRRIMPRNL